MREPGKAARSAARAAGGGGGGGGGAGGGGGGGGAGGGGGGGRAGRRGGGGGGGSSGVWGTRRGIIRLLSRPEPDTRPPIVGPAARGRNRQRPCKTGQVLTPGGAPGPRRGGGQRFGIPCSSASQRPMKH